MIMVMSWVFVCVPGDHDDDADDAERAASPPPAVE